MRKQGGANFSRMSKGGEEKNWRFYYITEDVNTYRVYWLPL